MQFKSAAKLSTVIGLITKHADASSVCQNLLTTGQIIYSFCQSTCVFADLYNVLNRLTVITEYKPFIHV